MITLNKIAIYKDKTVGYIEEHGVRTYVCAGCGRMVTHTNGRRIYGLSYCTKHYRQMHKYGKLLDTNPRTTLDKNEIRIDGAIAYIDLYDKDCNKVATTMIDAEDVSKVRYTKWKYTCSGYAANTPKYKGVNKYMHRVVLGVEDFVDHINHDKLDNRKSNLRVVTKSQNQMNSNHRGVSRQANGKFMAHIKLHQKMLNLGTYIDEEEALFARWYAETIVFKEYKYPKEKPIILPIREKEIMEYVNKKVQRL